MIIITYVDNILITGPDTQGIKDIKKALQDIFEIDDLGTASYFLGVRIIRDCTIRSITLIQDAYISKVLYKYSIQNCKSVSTLIDPGTLNLMISNLNQAIKQEIEEY